MTTLQPSQSSNSAKPSIATMLRRGFLAASLLGAMGTVFFSSAFASSEARLVPPLAQQARVANTATTETAIIAGGCFWGVQGVFQHVKGVSNAVSGYAGGAQKTALYDDVSSGSTGHAEAVQITFDPRLISYADLLQIYFSVAHDPTQVNRQGPDVGTQYRSAVFPINETQARIAKAYIAQLDQTKIFNSAIATKIEPGQTFFQAEAYHQDFLTQHPTHPYIAVNDLPKLEDLKHMFPERYQATPVLVGAERKFSQR